MTLTKEQIEAITQEAKDDLQVATFQNHPASIAKAERQIALCDLALAGLAVQSDDAKEGYVLVKSEDALKALETICGFANDQLYADPDDTVGIEAMESLEKMLTPLFALGTPEVK